MEPSVNRRDLFPRARGLAFSLVVLAVISPARADMFDVKGVEITKGESELALALAPQWGHNANSGNVRLHGEASFGYGFTPWFKAGGKLGFELGSTGTDDATYGGIETQFLILDPEKARLGLGWFTGFDTGFSGDFGQLLTFGPIASLTIAEGLTVTINPLLQKQWDPTEPGLALNYAWQVKREINDNIAIGFEGYGAVPNLADPPSIDFQEHRAGPVVFLSRKGGGTLDGDSMKLGVPVGTSGQAGGGGVELQLGVLFGFTEATPDTTGRAKLSLTW
jgi:hypothetical protein